MLRIAVTQRRNAGQCILAADSERLVCLQLSRNPPQKVGEQDMSRGIYNKRCSPLQRYPRRMESLSPNEKLENVPFVPGNPQTGLPTKGKCHTVAGINLRRGLQLLLREPSLDQGDGAIAKLLLIQLQSALSSGTK